MLGIPGPILDNFGQIQELPMPTRSRYPTERADARVRVGPLMGIPGLTRKLGAEPDRIFEQAGLPPAAFVDPDTKVPFVAASRLLALSAQATHCDHFGLLLGQSVSSTALGLPGFMARAASTVRAALQMLVEHLVLHDEGGTAWLSSDEDTTTLAYRLHHANNPAEDHIYDLSMAIACNILRDLCGPQWSPIAVRLSRHTCPDRAAYQRFFRSPLEFGAPFGALVFATRCLDQATPLADPPLLAHLQREAAALHTHRSSRVRDRLRELLAGVLARGDLSAVDVARRLGMHERTLHRRLQAEGTSFRDEVRQFRAEIACRLLAETEMPLSEIGVALGYADETAFSRAFKSWSGMTASQWRRSHRD